MLHMAKTNDAPLLRAVPAEPEEQITSAPTVLAIKTRKPRQAAEESTSRLDAPSFRRASRAIAERRTKPSRRRTTIYFDVDVASQLSAALIERDQELSDAVNAAVKAWLRAAK